MSQVSICDAPPARTIMIVDLAGPVELDDSASADHAGRAAKLPGNPNRPVPDAARNRRREACEKKSRLRASRESWGTMRQPLMAKAMPRTDTTDSQTIDGEVTSNICLARRIIRKIRQKVRRRVRFEPTRSPPRIIESTAVGS